MARRAAVLALFLMFLPMFAFAQQAEVKKEATTLENDGGETAAGVRSAMQNYIQAFQEKINVKQEYLAYYVRKHIHNCYDAMTISSVESINCHIKHRSKASTLNNTSRSLMLITEGTNSRIAGIDNSAKREL